MALKEFLLYFGLAFMVRNAGAQSALSSPPSSPTTFVPVTRSIALTMPMPQGPAEILKLASAMNGLDVPSTRPWHVKLAWDQFDEDGDNVQQWNVGGVLH
jgi:hypothetical protein